MSQSNKRPIVGILGYNLRTSAITRSRYFNCSKCCILIGPLYIPNSCLSSTYTFSCIVSLLARAKRAQLIATEIVL